MTEATYHRLEGRVVLVTGASRGIGRAIARELAGLGAKVVVNYSQAAEAAAALVAEIETAGGIANAVQADVAKMEDCERLVGSAISTYGQIDVLVNNAGINRDRLIMRMSPDEWQAVMDTDLTSAFNLTRLVVPSMRERRYGRIVNIASIIGQTGNVGQANYAAAKAGLIALTKTAAQELARFGVTVNAICPGFVETDMVNRLSEEQKAAIIAKVPLGRFGRPEEVASLCRYLIAEGEWITGQQLNVNGGQYM